MRAVGLAQRAHRREQAQRAAARRQEQFAHGRRQRIGIAARHVLDDEDARLVLVVERRTEMGAARRLRQMQRRRCALRRSPSPDRRAAGIAQGGRGDQGAMRRLQHLGRQRNGGIDPVALEPDIGVAAVLAR